MSYRDSLSEPRETLRNLGSRLVKIATELKAGMEIFEGERLAQFGIGILVFLVFLGLFAPFIAPYDPHDTQFNEEGDVVRLEGPSSNHPLGTTEFGRDVLSQVIVSSRVSLFVGLLAALIATGIGTNVGLIAGYYGGRVDEILMRVVDIAFALPFLPMAIALVFIFGASLTNIVLVIALLIWRSSARVIRSEVLTQKERPYVTSAKAVGASTSRIMYRHILPNVLPIVVLYLAFGVAWAVIFEASISFLGFGDPELISWGVMMNRAYNSGAIRYAYWWVVPPGMMIMLAVMSVFFIGRTLERITNPELRHR